MVTKRGVDARGKSRRPVHVMLMEASSLCAFAALQGFAWLRLTPFDLVEDSPFLSHAVFVVLALVSWLLADMLSGIAHYMADNHGSETTPLIGRTLIQPFREHHQEPRAMLEHGFLERNGNNALISLSVLFWIPFAPPTPIFRALAAVCSMMTLWVLATNQIHAWAHQESPPALARVLQKLGVILSPQHHAVHHAPFETARRGDLPPLGGEPGGHYCITSGACDRLAALIRPTPPSLELAPSPPSREEG